MAESLPGLQYAVNSDWTKQTPASPARAAQYSIASGAEPSDVAELIIYYFGRQGAGPVEANIDRWIGQFAEEGRDVADTNVRTRFGIRIHEMAVHGTYIAEVTPGSTERHNKPNHALRAAIVESDAGPYYFRLTGPRSAVEAHLPSWNVLLASLRPAPVEQEQVDAAAEHPVADDG